MTINRSSKNQQSLNTLNSNLFLMKTGAIEKRVLILDLSDEPIVFRGTPQEFSERFDVTTDARQTLKRLESSPSLFSKVYVDANLDGNVYSKEIGRCCKANKIPFELYEPPFQIE
ncbi:MAG: hypothetical protein AABY22_13050 [Nanoarchaeota archaeon]